MPLIKISPKNAPAVWKCLFWNMTCTNSLFSNTHVSVKNDSSIEVTFPKHPSILESKQSALESALAHCGLALSFLHHNGLVYDQLNPSDVLVPDDGSQPTLSGLDRLRPAVQISDYDPRRVNFAELLGPCSTKTEDATRLVNCFRAAILKRELGIDDAFELLTRNDLDLTELPDKKVAKALSNDMYKRLSKLHSDLMHEKLSSLDWQPTLRSITRTVGGDVKSDSVIRSAALTLANLPAESRYQRFLDLNARLDGPMAAYARIILDMACKDKSASYCLYDALDQLRDKCLEDDGVMVSALTLLRRQKLDDSQLAGFLTGNLADLEASELALSAAEIDTVKVLLNFV